MIPLHLLAVLFEEKSATQAGTVIKEVACENCGFEYVYQVRRTARGRASTFLGAGAEGMAAVRAGDNLTRVLKAACDPVPCPECGWYQKDMVARLRRSHRRGLLVAGLVLFPVAIILGMAGLVVVAVSRDDRRGGTPLAAPALLILAGIAAVLAVTLPVVKGLLSWYYNPNALDQDARMELGRARAVSRRAYVADNVIPPPPGETSR